jgi:16S rRNA (guanine527-N7)-methyltransferase
MDPGQISALLQPFCSTPPTSLQLNRISTYIDILLKWNRKVNLTAVRDPEQIVVRHFGESLFTAEYLFPKSAAASASGSPIRLADVGSGAGFPGLPIKIVAPAIRLTLIESHNKKATFLREVIRCLELSDAEVFTGRAQSFPRASSDVITLRAVEHFEEILPIAADLVAAAGRLALLIGQSQIGHVRDSGGGFDWMDPVPIPLSSARVLLIGSSSPRV